MMTSPIYSFSHALIMQELCRFSAIDVHRLRQPTKGVALMGRGILLWLLGVPIPIIILLALFWR